MTVHEFGYERAGLQIQVAVADAVRIVPVDVLFGAADVLAGAMGRKSRSSSGHQWLVAQCPCQQQCIGERVSDSPMLRR